MTDQAELVRVEFRCPHRRRDHVNGGFFSNPLFAVIQLPPGSEPEGVVEIACYRCKRRMSGSDPTVARVIHRFRITGQPVDTLVSREQPVLAVAEGAMGAS